MKKGIFVTLEGLSGSGKTTIARMLAQEYGAFYYKTPSSLFIPIRSTVNLTAAPLARHLYYFAGIAQASDEIVEALGRGPVVCDKYVATMLAYSYEYLRHERVKPSSPQELANLTDDGYDQSFAMVKVNINFDYPDKVLSEAFSKMLRHIRKTQPVIENRGGTSVEDALKQLAASRLVRVFEGAKAAETFIGRHKYDPPYEGAGPSGWTKANSQVTKWLVSTCINPNTYQPRFLRGNSP